MAVTKKLVEDLEGIVGSKYVMDQDFAQYAYGAAGIFFMNTMMEVSDRSAPPEVIVKPRTTEEVSEIMKLANETKTPVTIRGGGEGYWIGGSKDRGIMIDMTDMKKFIEYDEVSRTARAQAGITWGTLNEELEKYGVGTGNYGTHGLLGACVAGTLNADSPGPGGGKYGMPGENVTNLEVVLPTGEVIRTGSLLNEESKFHFRYCNGPDLAGMFIGSGGIYGIMTEVWLKTRPLYEHSETVGYSYPDFNTAVHAVNEIQSDGYLTEYAVVPPAGIVEDLLGAMFGKGRPLTLVVTESHSETIEEAQKAEIDKIAKKYGGRLVGLGGLLDALGFGLYDRHEFLGGNMLGLLGPNATAAVTCSIQPLLTAPEVMEAEFAVCRKYEDSYAYSRLLGGKVWLGALIAAGELGAAYAPTVFSFDPSNDESRKTAYRVVHELLEVKWRTGYATQFSNTREWETPHVVRRYDPQSLELMKKIKETLDPNNILNRDFVIPTSPYEKVDKIIAEMESEEVKK